MGEASSSSGHQTPSGTVGKVLLNTNQLAVKKVEPYVFANEQSVTYDCGDIIAHSRNRCEVIVEFAANANTETVFNNLERQAGVQGVMVSHFENIVVAVVFKDRNRDVKFNGILKTVCKGRRSDDATARIIQLFRKAKSGHSNINIELKSDQTNEDGKIPDIKEVFKRLIEAKEQDLIEMVCHARKAKLYNEMTLWDRAILTYESKLTRWIQLKEEAVSTLRNIEKPGHHPHLRDFKKSVLLPLQGVHYDLNEGLRTISFIDAILKEEAPQKPPLMYSKTLIFVGNSQTGKSELLHALCRECCERAGMTKYSIGGSIDPLGILTKVGFMDSIAAIALHDFEMKSKGGQWLPAEEAKSMLYVKEDGHVTCRYHQAILPPFVPRFWAVNYGLFTNGQVDVGSWFRGNNLHGLDWLVNKDEDMLRRADQHNQAIARRAVIFRVDENLYAKKKRAATDLAAYAKWQEMMENAWKPTDSDDEESSD